MGTRLFFTYTALISPDLLVAAAPGAEFCFIAHLPETEMLFPITSEEWEGSLPSVHPQGGCSVWGAVFEVPDAEVAGLNQVEELEGRIPSDVFQAVDRQGRRFQVLTHTVGEDEPAALPPSRSYMDLVIAGARHWNLPAGWVAGLQEYIS